MARRGFFAELHHQAKVAAREQARANRDAERAYRSAVRQAEQTRKADERAAAQFARATVAERKALDKLARDAHLAAMEAEVERRNLELNEIYDEIDSLLAATLDVDDYVDLASLRTAANHPPFDRADLQVPVPTPALVPGPTAPVCMTPARPEGLRGLLGKRQHAKAVEEAHQAHERAIKAWQDERAKLAYIRGAAMEDHLRAEAQRTVALEAEWARYTAECAIREAEAAERNAAIEQLIVDLGYGTAEAIQEYVSIVLSNSAYPAHFQVDYQFAFEPTTAELQLRVLIPGPEQLPNIKAYKHTKSSDAITTTSLSQKACKDRYAGAVHQVALRSIHEVFEADRRGLIKTMALEVGTTTNDPATGLDAYVPFVAAGAERESFTAINLPSVVPAATLAHLGAAVSKNPFGLVAADVTGIRTS